MTHVTITSTSVLVRFSGWEKIAGLVRDQDVDRRLVVSVAVVPDGLAAAEGIRAPGLGIPGRRKIGTWRGRGRRDLVSVRRGEPALSIELAGSRYTRLLIGTPDAADLAHALVPVTGGSTRGA